MMRSMRIAFIAVPLFLAVVIACGQAMSSPPQDEGAAPAAAPAAPAPAMAPPAAAPAAPAPAMAPPAAAPAAPAPAMAPPAAAPAAPAPAMAPPAAAPAAPAPAMAPPAAAPAAPAPAMAPPAAAPAAPAPAMAPPPVARAPAPSAAPVPGGYEEEVQASPGLAEGGLDDEIVLVTQTRIIVRTVDMGLVVSDVAAAIDAISDISVQLGGWVVSSDRSERHRGFMSIRVPADRLDSAVLQVRQLASEVESEISTSKDVTDEYLDTTARLKNLEATEQALINLLDRAARVEDALAVHRELTGIRAEIERLQGRIKFLEQTSAFSLINVNLRLAPIDMSTDAGIERTFSEGQPARFRATFTPPEDIDEFLFTWDFGDGSRPVQGNRTAPTLQEGTRVTATVTHVYTDDRDSPYIVEVKIIGTGKGGVAEGEGTVIATVTELPTIEVFAGETKSVEEGTEVEFEGSFTHPAGITDLRYRWEFGDGSTPFTGGVAEGVTSARVTHIYSDHRPFPFTVTLTVTAQSEAGEIGASDSVIVLVTESRGWVLAGWSAGDQWKGAIRSLSGVGQGVATLLIWLAIFSPVWIIGGGLGLLLFRRFRSRRAAVGSEAAPG